LLCLASTFFGFPLLLNSLFLLHAISLDLQPLFLGLLLLLATLHFPLLLFGLVGLSSRAVLFLLLPLALLAFLLLLSFPVVLLSFLGRRCSLRILSWGLLVLLSGFGLFLWFFLLLLLWVAERGCKQEQQSRIDSQFHISLRH